MKYIEAEKLIRAIEDKGLNCSFAIKMERLDTLALIDELQQEQPEVDLEEEINKFFEKVGMPVHWCNDAEQQEFCSNLARHFYGLRNRALEEAARHVYESWMGGTMDDVRRDMAELGKVLNARKED